MIKVGVMEMVRWLNTFPPKGGVSTEYSLWTIMMGQPIDYNRHCKMTFGSYCQASQQNTPTNTINPQTVEGIHLRALENIQGVYELMNLLTGKIITRHKVAEIPINKEIIDRVEFLAKQDDIKPDLIFKTKSGEVIPDDVLIAGVDDEDNTTTTQETDSDEHSDYDEDDNSKSAGVDEKNVEI